MPSDVTITIRIDHSLFTLSGEPFMLRYTIPPQQVIDLQIGRRPPVEDILALCDWHMRRDRAEALAKHIAADLAHKMLQAFEQRR